MQQGSTTEIESDQQARDSNLPTNGERPTVLRRTVVTHSKEAESELRSSRVKTTATAAATVRGSSSPAKARPKHHQTRSENHRQHGQRRLEQGTSIGFQSEQQGRGFTPPVTANQPTVEGCEIHRRWWWSHRADKEERARGFLSSRPEEGARWSSHHLQQRERSRGSSTGGGLRRTAQTERERELKTKKKTKEKGELSSLLQLGRQRREGK